MLSSVDVFQIQNPSNGQKELKLQGPFLLWFTLFSMKNIQFEVVELNQIFVLNFSSISLENYSQEGAYVLLQQFLVSRSQFASQCLLYFRLSNLVLSTWMVTFFNLQFNFFLVDLGAMRFTFNKQGAIRSTLTSTRGWVELL